MKNIIPGHMRAITWVLALALALVAYYVTRRFASALGAVVLTIGFFVADQAVHLAQNDHSAPPPTWIERMQQKYQAASVLSGLLLVMLGAYLMLRPWE